MFIFSQNDTLIKGKVVSESNSLEGIHIFNISQKTGEITDARGYFNIKVKISDTLQFSAVHLKATQYIIKQNDLKEELIFVQMKSLISELDEITLTKYKNINAVSLGIVPRFRPIAPPPRAPAPPMTLLATSGTGHASRLPPGADRVPGLYRTFVAMGGQAAVGPLHRLRKADSPRKGGAFRTKRLTLPPRTPPCAKRPFAPGLP